MERTELSTAMDSRQRKAAIVSGVVLAAMAVGIYLVVILKFFAR